MFSEVEKIIRSWPKKQCPFLTLSEFLIQNLQWLHKNVFFGVMWSLIFIKLTTGIDEMKLVLATVRHL